MEIAASSPLPSPVAPRAGIPPNPRVSIHRAFPPASLPRPNPLLSASRGGLGRRSPVPARASPSPRDADNGAAVAPPDALAAAAPLQAVRVGEVDRVTKETNVRVKLNLDGSGVADCSTGIPFLDHMLDQLASHGLFDLTVKASGDIHIDDHHTNEDVALAIGTALLKALGDRKGIYRFGNFSAPLDEAAVNVILDLSGRPHLSYDLCIPTERVGTYDTQLVEHFFQSLVNTSGMTLHIQQANSPNYAQPTPSWADANVTVSISMGPIAVDSKEMRHSLSQNSNERLGNIIHIYGGAKTIPGVNLGTNIGPKIAGRNAHHIIEATFKAFARALRQATEHDTRRRGAVPSSKGVLSRS